MIKIAMKSEMKKKISNSRYNTSSINSNNNNNKFPHSKILFPSRRKLIELKNNKKSKITINSNNQMLSKQCNNSLPLKSRSNSSKISSNNKSVNKVYNRLRYNSIYNRNLKLSSKSSIKDSNYKNNSNKNNKFHKQSIPTIMNKRMAVYIMMREFNNITPIMKRLLQ